MDQLIVNGSVRRDELLKDFIKEEFKYRVDSTKEAISRVRFLTILMLTMSLFVLTAWWGNDFNHVNRQVNRRASYLHGLRADFPSLDASGVAGGDFCDNLVRVGSGYEAEILKYYENPSHYCFFMSKRFGFDACVGGGDDCFSVKNIMQNLYTICWFMIIIIWLILLQKWMLLIYQLLGWAFLRVILG